MFFLNDLLTFFSRKMINKDKKKTSPTIKLLRLPLNQLSATDDYHINITNIIAARKPPEKKSYQLLKVDINNVNTAAIPDETPHVKLFHLPRQKENRVNVNYQQTNKSQQQKPQLLQPRLLDLRTVLNLKPQPLTSQKETALPQKTPHLIRLPPQHIPQTKLLDSPKQENVQPIKKKSSSRRRRDKHRKILDIRQSPEILRRVDDKEQQTTPRFFLFLRSILILTQLHELHLYLIREYMV